MDVTNEKQIEMVLRISPLFAFSSMQHYIEIHFERGILSLNSWHATVPSCTLGWRAGAIRGDEEAHHIKLSPIFIWRKCFRIFHTHLPMACNQPSCLHSVRFSGVMHARVLATSWYWCCLLKAGIKMRGRPISSLHMTHMATQHGFCLSVF